MADLTHRFANSSVRTKVTAVVVAVSVAAVAVMAAAYGFIGLNRTRDALAQQMRGLARVTANNLAAAVIFEDPASARTTLASLHQEPNVRASRIVLPDGAVLARYPGNTRVRWQTPASDTRMQFGPETVEVVHPIRKDGRAVAHLQVKAGLKPLKDSRTTLLTAGAAVVIGAIAIAVLLARPLCGFIIRPIEELAGAADRVRRTGDLSVRVPRRWRDEVGELVAAFNDMLDRIRGYQSHMEELVEQRTQDLARSNEELRRTVDALESAKQEAETSDAAKTRFLANMSHELRTPLNAILGFSEMLQHEVMGPLGNAKYREYSNDIHASAAHLLEVINDVLDVARLESGRFSLNEEETELRALCGEAERMLSVTAEHRGVALSCAETGAWDARVRCDPARMRQVVLNLVSNAVKFTPEGGSVRIECDLLDSGEAAVRVRDTGAGMDPADVPQILEPFTQVASPYARDHQGTGLGLALSNQIVEMHDGHLDIHTAPGEGTTVTAVLPAARVIATGKAAAPAGAPS
ncbi:Signal transduction histidine kinase [Limimonas halophila]|uniref:histidine kinase n=1 Tax=Limimonas halophila TaxID=1082479 RepID=A0A1G7T010_9PROT|nr:ATP-binding protein [Limimonas halophila]SDG28686.1 Signal transduction histidine kinase [Limimonas halophila]